MHYLENITLKGWAKNTFGEEALLNAFTGYSSYLITGDTISLYEQTEKTTIYVQAQQADEWRKRLNLHLKSEQLRATVYGKELEYTPYEKFTDQDLSELTCIVMNVYKKIKSGQLSLD